MENVKNFRYLPVVAGALMLFASCQDEDFGYTSKQIAYRENFEKSFGNIDPNQNWDLFGQLAAGGETRGMGTRATTSTSIGDIQITDLPKVELTKSEATAYAQMLPESESTSSKYGETNLGRVTQNFSVQLTELELYPVYWNTSGSNTIGLYYYADASTTGAEKITGIDGVDYYVVRVPIMGGKTNLEYYKTEGGGEVRIHEYQITNDAALYHGLLKEKYPTKYIVADGTQKDKYGEIITNGSLIVAVADCYEVLNGYTAGVASDLATGYPSRFVCKNSSDLYEITSSIKTYNSCSEQNVGTHFTRDGAEGLRSQGVKVILPTSTKIGMYLQQELNIFYSESNLNYNIDFGGTDGVKPACHVATFTQKDESGVDVLDKDGKPIRFLCFEDWYNVQNFDLNDLVFRVYGFDNPGTTIVDNDEYDETAILVCEDLGDFDFDYNDVVLKLNYHESETKTYTKNSQGVVTNVTSSGVEKALTVTALAAGGANQTTVAIGSYSWGEIHDLLGGAAPSIINAGAKMGAEGQSLKMTASTNPKMPDYTHSETQKYLSQLFANGDIKISTKSDGANTNDSGINLVSSADYKTKGSPTMILLPADYEWCQERQPIDKVYPGFTQWVSDATLTNWLSSKASGTGKYTKR